MFGSEGFFAAVAQQGTMFSGVPMGIQGGFPQLGAMNIFAQPLLAGLMSQIGMFPGQFSPTGNVYDLMRNNIATIRQQQMAAMAAQNSDMQTWLRTTGGLARSMGLPWGLDQAAAFGQAYGMASPVLGAVAQFAPQLVDALHGSRGSAAVMSQGIFRGGRFGVDALTGMPGMTMEGMGALSRTIADTLYNTPEQIAEMRGVGMGQLGMIFDEGMRRGLMPGSIGARSRETQMRMVAREEGTTVDQLRGLDEATFGEKLRRFDANKITSRLKDLSGAVTAMRDIFGENGRPDAPMSQIINALEAITQNRLASMAPGQVTQLVRKTKAVMDVTGVGLDGLMSLTARAGGLGDALGLDRSFAPLAGQQALMFGAGYRGAFGGSFTAFGAMNLDEVQARELNLRQRSNGSEQAQFAGAVIRTVSALGLDGSSPAGRLAAALKRGDTTFDGRSMFDVLSRGNLMSMFGREGGSALQAAMSDPFGNQEAIQKYNLGNLVRQLQPEEMIRRMGAPAGESAVMRALVAGGMSSEEAARKARTVGPDLLRALLETDDVEALSTAEGRQGIISGVLQKAFGDRGAAMAGSVAIAFESAMNKSAKFYGFGDLTKLLQNQNQTVLRQAARVDRQASIEAGLAEALSPLGRAGPIQRVVDILSNKPDLGNEDILKLVGEGLGGISIDDIRRLSSEQEIVRRLGGKEQLTDADKQELARAQGAITSLVGRISKVGQETGADIGRNIDQGAFDLAAGSQRDITSAIGAKDIGRAGSMVGTQLARANNLVQGLYLDDATMRRLGKGGFETAKAVEAKYLQMLRLTGGDTELIARALSGDKTVPEELRNQLVALNKDLSAGLSDLQERSKLGAGMTDEEWKAEKARIDSFRKERTAGDREQTDRMLERIAGVGGLKLSAEERGSLAGLLGGMGEAKRKDLMYAIESREKLAKIAKERGVSIDDLRGDKSLTEDFTRAGTLAEFAGSGAGDTVSLRKALERFAPASAAKKPEIKITGTLTVKRTGEGDLEGQGNQGGSDSAGE